MKAIFTFFIALALLAEAPTVARAAGFRESVWLILDASTFQLYEKDTKRRIQYVLLRQGGSVELTVENLGTNPAETVTVTPFKADNAQMGKSHTYTKDGETYTFQALEEGYLLFDPVRTITPTTVTDSPSGGNESQQGSNRLGAKKLSLVVARPSRIVPAFNAGAIYTFQKRRTYTLNDALDVSGTPIPGRKRIVERRNDDSVSSTVSGKLYYVFGEDQRNDLVKWVQEISTLGLYTPGASRYGMFLGVAGTEGDTANYQLGVSYFPDRNMNIAFSMGLNLAQGQRLTGGFQPRDIVTLTDVSTITESRWTGGFFFSVTFNASSD